MKASIRERILAGNLDEVRVVVESLAQEFDIADIAAAAVMLAHAADEKEDAEHEIPAIAQPGRPAKRPDSTRHGRDSREDVVRLFISAGRDTGIRPGDLVGAITGEAGVTSRDLGAIEISDRYSLIDVPESRAEEIMAALRATKLRGKRVKVRLDRGK